jgi:hypothetical protein
MHHLYLIVSSEQLREAKSKIFTTFFCDNRPRSPQDDIREVGWLASIWPGISPCVSTPLPDLNAGSEQLREAKSKIFTTFFAIIAPEVPKMTSESYGALPQYGLGHTLVFPQLLGT